MQIQSSIVVDETISQIYSKFKNELKIKQLSKLIPQYNTDYVSKIAGSAVITAFMKQPKLKSIFGYDQMHEDVFPKHIHIDQFANFQVKVNGDQIGGPIVRDKQPMASSKQTNRYRKTGSTFRNSSISKRKKQQEKQDLSKYFVVPPNTNNELYQLPFQPPTQQQTDLQYELRAMQKKLYFTRQQKKKEEQEQQERIKALKKRKSPEMPRTDFTYELNGNFMKRKPFKSDSLLVDEMKHCQSFDLKPKDKKSLNELLEEQEEVRGRSQLNSRYQRANLFNNSNKRQVSHLPFIKMSQNSKMREDNRNSEGNRTQRVSLKTFAESMEEKSFRHYSEIERQKKQRELLQKLQAQRIEKMSEKTDKNPEQPQDSYNGNRRRQSYLMNKYLKKLKQQSVEQNRKSLNFNRVSFPKNTAIHNYYKHDFNEERRFYESEVISRVLDNSGNTTAR